MLSTFETRPTPYMLPPMMHIDTGPAALHYTATRYSAPRNRTSGERMATSTKTDGDLRQPLSAQVFQILLSLLDDDLHGYALIQDIRRRTDGEVSLTASTLYAAAKRLLGAGWIEEVEHDRPPPGHDDRRRYYRITARGRAAARAEARRLERLTAMARDKRLLGTFRSTAQPKGSR